MIDLFIQTLNIHKYKIDDKIAELETLEENPLSFFAQGTGISEELFIELLHQRDPQYVTDYQKWLYPKMIEEMKRRFNIEDYSVSFQPLNFPSPIQFTHEMHTVASIYPFEKKFVYHFPNHLYALYEERRSCLIQMVQIEEDLALKEMIEASPILAGKGSAWKTTKAMMSPKKVKAEVKQEAVALLDEMSQLNRRVTEINHEIEQIDDQWITRTVHLDRLASRMEEVLNLEVINPIFEIEEKEEHFRQIELAKERESYRKALYTEWGLDEAGVAF